MVDPWASPRTDKGWKCPECGQVREGHRAHFAEVHGMHPTASLYRQEILLEKIYSRVNLIAFIYILMIRNNAPLVGESFRPASE